MGTIADKLNYTWNQKVAITTDLINKIGVCGTGFTMNANISLEKLAAFIKNNTEVWYPGIDSKLATSILGLRNPHIIYIDNMLNLGLTGISYFGQGTWDASETYKSWGTFSVGYNNQIPTYTVATYNGAPALTTSYVTIPTLNSALIQLKVNKNWWSNKVSIGQGVVFTFNASGAKTLKVRVIRC